MAYIITTIDLQKYRDQLERQMSVLPLSNVFSDEEKEDVKQCYLDLIAICETKLTNSIPAN